jgi:hypothetical protein
MQPSFLPLPTIETSSPAPTTSPIQNGLKEEDQGDMVFENAVLFLRDALLTRLFADAVKAGDSGLVIIVLKMWTFAYRGSGRSKYAHEMLHLFHNLVNVWSKGLRYAVCHLSKMLSSDIYLIQKCYNSKLVTESDRKTECFC